MEEIGKHISELLFDHDCVIIPSLGGFLASNQPSRILLPNHLIFPPYRRIAFNVYLKQNDGLFANHLVKSERITYTEATRQIESFTKGCFETLENGKKINITEVGLLFYDKEKNIQFEDFRNTNHLKDSYGMESIHFLPIQRDEKAEKKKLPLEKTIRSSLPQEKGKRSKFTLSNGKQIVGAVLILSVIVWFSLNLYFVAPKKYESTSLNPFDSQNIKINQTDSIRNIPSDAVTANTTQNTETVAQAPLITDTITSLNNKIDSAVKNDIDKNVVTASTTEINKDKKNSAPLPQVIENSFPASSNKHYLIAGVFKIKENAQSMALHLQQLGFKNTRIIEANKCSYVSFDEFSRQDDALAFADSLHKKNIEGWIWKH